MGKIKGLKGKYIKSLFYKAVRLSPLFLATLLLAGCSSNANRALYEGIKTQNEVNKTPAERAMNPTPSYDAYRKEKENLKQNNSAASDKNDTPEFSLK